MIGQRRQGDPHGFLAAYQREARAQADRWFETELQRALAPSCNCEFSDAWRCAVARHASSLSCACRCHRLPVAA